MSKIKTTQNFGVKAVTLDEERTMRVIATAPTLDRDGDVLDTATARVPIKPTGWKHASDLTEEDDIDLPLLLDHEEYEGIQKMAGAVKKMYINEDGQLEAIVKLAPVDNGDRVYALAKDDALGNSFSIGFDTSGSTVDGEGVIKDYEIVELSVVFKGSNRDARVVEVKSVKSEQTEAAPAKAPEQEAKQEKEMTLDEKKEQLAQLQKEIAEAENAEADAADDSTDDSTDVSDEQDEKPEQVTPSVPELKDNEVIIPVQAGVDYLVSGEVVTGNVKVPEAGLTVDAKPQDGYEFPSGVSAEWSYDYQAASDYDSSKSEDEADDDSSTEPTDGEKTVEPAETQEPKAEQTETKIDTDIKSEKETKKMDDIAKKQVQAPLAPVEHKAETDYLSTKSAVLDFAHILHDNAGADAKTVKSAWSKELQGKGITNPEVLLPTPVAEKIISAFEKEGSLWSRVFKTGAKAFQVLFDTSENNRAGGHQNGDTKEEEDITLAPRLIRSQIIYKYLTIDRSTEFEDEGALLDYVLTELPRRIVNEIERAIVIGDGRADTDKQKIREFISVKADAASNDGYAVAYTPAPSEKNYQKLINAQGLLDTENRLILVAKKSFVTSLRLQENSNGGLVFNPGTDLAAGLGLDAIYTPKWADSDAHNDAYLFAPDDYYTVGQNNIDALSDFKLETNERQYLQEIKLGGALAAANSGVAIAAVAQQS